MGVWTMDRVNRRKRAFHGVLLPPHTEIDYSSGQPVFSQCSMMTFPEHRQDVIQRKLRLAMAAQRMRRVRKNHHETLDYSYRDTWTRDPPSANKQFQTRQRLFKVRRRRREIAKRERYGSVLYREMVQLQIQRRQENRERLAKCLQQLPRVIIGRDECSGTWIWEDVGGLGDYEEGEYDENVDCEEGDYDENVDCEEGVGVGELSDLRVRYDDGASGEQYAWPPADQEGWDERDGGDWNGPGLGPQGALQSGGTFNGESETEEIPSRYSMSSSLRKAGLWQKAAERLGVSARSYERDLVRSSQVNAHYDYSMGSHTQFPGASDYQWIGQGDQDEREGVSYWRAQNESLTSQCSSAWGDVVQESRAKLMRDVNNAAEQYSSKQEREREEWFQQQERQREVEREEQAKRKAFDEQRRIAAKRYHLQKSEKRAIEEKRVREEREMREREMRESERREQQELAGIEIHVRERGQNSERPRTDYHKRSREGQAHGIGSEADKRKEKMYAGQDKADRERKEKERRNLIQNLQPNVWLGDEAVDFAINKLVKVDSLYQVVTAGITQGIKLCEPEFLEEVYTSDIVSKGRPVKPLLLFPLNSDTTSTTKFTANQGNHWSLIVYCHHDQKFYHFDSMQGANKVSSQRLVEKLVHVLQLPHEPEIANYIIEVPVKQQKHDAECGLHVALNAKLAIDYYRPRKSLSNVALPNPRDTAEDIRKSLLLHLQSDTANNSSASAQPQPIQFSQSVSVQAQAHVTSFPPLPAPRKASVVSVVEAIQSAVHGVKRPVIEKDKLGETELQRCEPPHKRRIKISADSAPNAAASTTPHLTPGETFLRRSVAFAFHLQGKGCNETRTIEQMSGDYGLPESESGLDTSSQAALMEQFLSTRCSDICAPTGTNGDKQQRAGGEEYQSLAEAPARPETINVEYVLVTEPRQAQEVVAILTKLPRHLPEKDVQHYTRIGLDTEHEGRRGQRPRARLVQIYSPRLNKTYLFYLGSRTTTVQMLCALTPLLTDVRIKKYVCDEESERQAFASHKIDGLILNSVIDIQKVASAVVADVLHADIPKVVKLSQDILSAALNVPSNPAGPLSKIVGIGSNMKDAFRDVTNPKHHWTNALLKYAAHDPYAAYMVASRLSNLHPSVVNLRRLGVPVRWW